MDPLNSTELFLLGVPNGCWSIEKERNGWGGAAVASLFIGRKWWRHKSQHFRQLKAFMFLQFPVYSFDKKTSCWMTWIVVDFPIVALRSTPHVHLEKPWKQTAQEARFNYEEMITSINWTGPYHAWPLRRNTSKFSVLRCDSYMNPPKVATDGRFQLGKQDA